MMNHVDTAVLVRACAEFFQNKTASKEGTKSSHPKSIYKYLKEYTPIFEIYAKLHTEEEGALFLKKTLETVGNDQFVFDNRKGTVTFREVRKLWRNCMDRFRVKSCIIHSYCLPTELHESIQTEARQWRLKNTEGFAHNSLLLWLNCGGIVWFSSELRVVLYTATVCPQNCTRAYRQKPDSDVFKKHRGFCSQFSLVVTELYGSAQS